MREKPEFPVSSGGWIEPEFFTDELRSELRLLLNISGLTADQQSDLINFASEMAQVVFDGPRTPHKQIVSELEAIESNARRLLASLNSLSPQTAKAIHAHTGPMAFGAYRELPIADHVRRGDVEGFLGRAWDWVDALEQVAVLTADKYQLDRQTKPDQLRARGYVSMAAGYVHQVTGTFPPKDRSAWFAGFMGAVGGYLGYEIGPRMIASGIEQAAAPTR